MAAPQIPNLKELLGSRGGRGDRRGHGRARGAPRSCSSDGAHGSSQDHIVQRTDDDASAARLSAVNAGYLTDEYASAFCKGTSEARRFPVINRGTYMRTTGIDRLVERFLDADAGMTKQIISLGAGTDTRFFRLASSRSLHNVIYHEIDFASNTKRKIDIIKGDPLLLKTLTKQLSDPDDVSFGEEGHSLKSVRLNIHPLDLRSLTASTLAALPHITSSADTLLLSECCLVYLSPEDNIKIMRTFLQSFSVASASLGIVIYEPIRPNDAFGRTMTSNLAARGIQLRTIQQYQDLKAQTARLRQGGFDTIHCAADVDFLYKKWLSPQDKSFVASREMMDEIEEWTLLAQHYCIAWGARDGSSAIFARAWQDLVSQPQS